MKTQHTVPNVATRAEALARIAHSVLAIETLETRKRDRLDFHDLAVWDIAAALEVAYNLGFAAARNN